MPAPARTAFSPSGPAGFPGPPEPIPASVWRLALIIVIGAFMANLDTALVNVGLETIRRDLDASLVTSQWIASGYLLALAAVLPMGSWLGRRVGVGRLWLWSLSAFTVISGLCALPQTIEGLIVLRVLQGAAGGLLIPAGQTVLGQAAGPARMGRVMATSGIAVVLAPALGPTVGGLLIAHLAWQWLFLINIPVGAAGLALGLRFVPRGVAGDAGTLDVTSMLLVVTGLPLLVYGITQAGERGTLTATPVLATFGCGLAALVLFVRRSLHPVGRHAVRRPRPLLDLRLYTNRVFTAAAVTTMFGSGALFGGLILLPLYFQTLRGEGIVETGLLLISQSLGTAILMPLAGRLTDRYGGGPVSVTGLAIAVVSTVPLALSDEHTSTLAIQMILLVRGAGTALAVMPAMSTAFATVARAKLPDATAQVNILQRVGGSIGSALTVILLSRSLADHPDSPATAFAVAFWWLTIMAVLALITAIGLLFSNRSPVLAPAVHSPARG